MYTQNGRWCIGTEYIYSGDYQTVMFDTVGIVRSRCPIQVAFVCPCGQAPHDRCVPASVKVVFQSRE